MVHPVKMIWTKICWYPVQIMVLLIFFPFVYEQFVLGKLHLTYEVSNLSLGIALSFGKLCSLELGMYFYLGHTRGCGCDLVIILFSLDMIFKLLYNHDTNSTSTLQCTFQEYRKGHIRINIMYLKYNNYLDYMITIIYLVLLVST